ncbi:MAG: glucosidase [Bacteroidota bacterium]
MADSRQPTAEHQRLDAANAGTADWRRWGTYLSDRAWGTVREDYSTDGDAWRYFPFDHARSRAYRWNEDGLAGFCDRDQRLCLAVALWNEQDAILKERFFGLSGHEGNHGEDVKELYAHLDATPTYAYAKLAYLYPHAAFPYQQLYDENRRRDRMAREFELLDALEGELAEGRYFDVSVEYAKAGPEDILCRIRATNKGPEAAPIHLLPHVWFRNTWAWDEDSTTPLLEPTDASDGVAALYLRPDPDGPTVMGPALEERWWYARALDPDGTVMADAPALLVTENETNTERLYDVPNQTPYVKDGIHRAVVQGDERAVNSDQVGTKAAAHVRATLEPGETLEVQVRLADRAQAQPFRGFAKRFDERIAEANAFYDDVHRQSPGLTDDAKLVQRQALAGLLWTQQFYHYDVQRWMAGDPAMPPPPSARRPRNRHWPHLLNHHIISMPDKWEYPWYAAWDLAFHMLPMALIDPEEAKRQLVLFTSEGFLHPNGQIPAYEWAFSDVNPPVHAWAALRVYQHDRDRTDTPDVAFLKTVFNKLLLNFTWWVNRKDVDGNNVFEGGFLGLDNIGVFDRSAPLPDGVRLEQADGTAWMGMYCLNMLTIAIELSEHDPVYEDLAAKFFEHFVYIARAINKACAGTGLWDDADGFYYDVLHIEGANYGADRHIPLKVQSFVGLTPLFATETLSADTLARLPKLAARVAWFQEHRTGVMHDLGLHLEPGAKGDILLSIVNRDKLERLLDRMLDSAQFLSPHGLRSLSKHHEREPYYFNLAGQTYEVRYVPGASPVPLFGGNSNWRGPVWMPVNHLMVESLQRFGDYFGDTLTVSLPASDGGVTTGHTLCDVAEHLARRLDSLFLLKDDVRVYRKEKPFLQTTEWRQRLLFHEYFHGDTGRGLGASHQTGWTAVVAWLLHGYGSHRVS